MSERIWVTASQGGVAGPEYSLSDHAGRPPENQPGREQTSTSALCSRQPELVQTLPLKEATESAGSPPWPNGELQITPSVLRRSGTASKACQGLGLLATR